MTFIEEILLELRESPERPVVQEVRSGRIVSATNRELLSLVGEARSFLKKAGARKGDRCVILAPNSIKWVALDLAMMTEGIIVVPLYTRQAAAELVAMMKDSGPSLVCCGDEFLRRQIARVWPHSPDQYVFDDIFTGSVLPDLPEPWLPGDFSESEPVTIIYTSGTSGEPRGVVLTVGNIHHMLGCTNARLDLLMGSQQQPDRVFHYLPFCFAGSWILLLTCLTRLSTVTLSTELTRLADEMKLAAPHYCLNVPAVLERIRARVQEEIGSKGRLVRAIYQRGRDAWFRLRVQNGGSGETRGSRLDPVWLSLCNSLVFARIRSKIGENLRALICGSAPLVPETQHFFQMLGIPVLQVYGLTETTAICTMDHPEHVVPGRVGPAIPQVEMRLGPGDEILVRGPNVFPGYWNRLDETAKVLKNDWFHTGDRGEVDAAGNWSIIGRLKNLIIPASGHNIAPEPIEEMVLRAVPGAQHVLLVGTGRSFLSAIVTGAVSHEQVESGLAHVNPQLPHYKRIRAFHVSGDPFTIENGLLTANGKLKRDAIVARLKSEIDGLYRVKEA